MFKLSRGRAAPAGAFALAIGQCPSEALAGHAEIDGACEFAGANPPPAKFVDDALFLNEDDNAWGSHASTPGIH